MRIAYFSDNFYPEISGISDSIITTGEELRRRGHEVMYVAPWYPKKEYEKNKRDDLVIKRLFSLPFPNSPTGQSRIVAPIGLGLWFLRKWKPDIIHTQSPHGAGLEAFVAARILRVPLIGTEHTPIREFFHYSPLVEKTFGATWLRYNRWYYNRCAFITAPYQGLIDDMRREDGLRVPGRGQANPVMLTDFAPPTLDEKAHIKKEKDLPGPTIIYSGRLAPEKKVDVVVHAVTRLVSTFPDLMFIVTGHGSIEEELKKLAKELGVERNVRFVGFVPVSELASLFKASDVLAFMSTADTQSLALMQAFATGIPAVCARARGLIDYTPPDAGFLVEPGDEKALAEKIELLLTNEELRQKMGKAGIEFVKQFSPVKIAEQWEKIYEQYKK